MRNFKYMIFPLLSLVFCACGKSEMDKPSPDGNEVRVGMSLSGEDNASIHDVRAFRFGNGVLQEVLSPVGGALDGTLVFSPERREGRLYLLANSSALDALGTISPGITLEEEFTGMVAGVEAMVSEALLMTGQLDLDREQTGVATVRMLRSVARIDLHSPEAGVQVLGVSVLGFSRQGHVFPQTDCRGVDGADTLTFVRDYAGNPFSGAREMLLYVPEQCVTDGPLVEIEALLDGGLHRLSLRLPRVLERNHIYTVLVRGNGAGLSASVLHGGWESGDVSDAVPDAAVTVDVAGSVLGEGVRVSPALDSVCFPYTGGSWRLALKMAPEAVVSVEGSVPGVTVSVAGDAAGLEISSELRRPGTVDGLVWLNVSEAGVQTGRVALVFEASPVVLDGMLKLDEEGLCDLGRYVDGDLGNVTVPAGKVVTVETGQEDLWMKVEMEEETADVRRYRVLAGWRPNDPNADGRPQEGTLVIADEDGRNREEYVVRRLNWGLPVVRMGDTWWTRYNLRGDVRSFPDQITCDEDPAAGKDLLELLRDIPADSLLVLMGDQYQAGFYEGLPLRHDGENFYHEGMRPSGQNFGLLDPVLMAPDGYSVPDYDDYAWLSANDNQNLGGTGTRTYTNRHGDRIQVTVVERDVDFLGHDYGTVSFYEFAHEDRKWVLFGLGHQWNTSPGQIARMHLLLATYGNPDQTWVMEGYEAADRPGQNWIKFTPQNHIKTRTIRCVKTPVEYIY